MIFCFFLENLKLYYFLCKGNSSITVQGSSLVIESSAKESPPMFQHILIPGKNRLKCIAEGLARIECQMFIRVPTGYFG
jgi:hypothetical protein